MHTHFEVQLTAPSVTSYGAVWVGFRCCASASTTTSDGRRRPTIPSESDLYRLTLKDGGYVLDGVVKPFV